MLSTTLLYGAMAVLLIRHVPAPGVRALAAVFAGSAVLLVGMDIPPNYGPAYVKEFSALFADVAKARKVPLVERPAAFDSGDVRLRGQLTLPLVGAGPFKAVIFVHGSDVVPSVGLEMTNHGEAQGGCVGLQ